MQLFPIWWKPEIPLPTSDFPQDVDFIKILLTLWQFTSSDAVKFHLPSSNPFSQITIRMRINIKIHKTHILNFFNIISGSEFRKVLPLRFWQFRSQLERLQLDFAAWVRFVQGQRSCCVVLERQRLVGRPERCWFLVNQFAKHRPQPTNSYAKVQSHWLPVGPGCRYSCLQRDHFPFELKFKRRQFNFIILEKS